MCSISGCKELYNRLLHRDKYVKTKNEEAEKNKEAPSITNKGGIIHHRSGASKE